MNTLLEWEKNSINMKGRKTFMKKTSLFKKMTAVVLAGIMVASMGTATAFAGEVNQEIAADNSLSDFILNNAQAHLSLFYGETSDEYYIGAEIPSYTMEGNQAFPLETTSYYPIYCADKPVGVFSVHSNSDGGVTLSYSEELFGQKIDLDMNANYCILSNEEGMHITNVNAISDIDGRTAYTPAIATKTAIPALTYSTKAGKSNYLNVDTSWNQGTTGLCWAGTIWAIGRYIYRNKTLPFTGSPYDIADELNISYDKGIPLNRLNEAFGLYNLTSSQYAISNKSYIIASIDDGKPIFAYWNCSSGAHAMTLCGYTVGGSNLMTIKCMDTLSFSHPESGVIRTYSSTSSTYEESGIMSDGSVLTLTRLYGVY